MNSRTLLVPCVLGVALSMLGSVLLGFLPLWLGGSLLVGAGGGSVVFLMARWKEHQAAALRRILREVQQTIWVTELQRIGLDLPMPWTDFSIAPDAGCILAREVLRQEPDVVVECGSGISTVLIAHCLKRLRKGRAYSLEHDAEWAQRTRQLLRVAGVGDRAVVIDAPLEARDIDSRTWRWYSGFEKHLPDSQIDLLFIDGPPPFPGAEGAHRYPAVPVLKHRLRDGALILLDDANRPEESKAVDDWISSCGCRLSSSHPTGRGLVILESHEATTTGDGL